MNKDKYQTDRYSDNRDDSLENLLDEDKGKLPSEKQNHFEEQKSVTDQISNAIRNALFSMALLILTLLWYYDWNPSRAVNGVYTTIDNVYTEVFGATDQAVPPVDIDERNASANDAPQIAPSTLDISYTEYLEQLNTYGYLEKFGSTSTKWLYENNVPVDYIRQLDQIDALDHFGSTSISRLYRNQIPLDYISALNEQNLLDDFGSTSISRLYSNNVPVDYLHQIDQLGALEQFGSTSISRLYQNGVTVEFLKDLKARGLIDNLSSTAIVDAYNSEN